MIERAGQTAPAGNLGGDRRGHRVLSRAGIAAGCARCEVMPPTVLAMAAIVLISITGVATTVAAQQAEVDSGATINVPQTDREMADAQRQARDSLARFWAVFDNPAAGEGGFALKVAVPIGARDSEHIWTNDIKRDGDKVSGVVNNAPQKAKSVGFGDRIEIAPDRISDWMYMRNGRIVGNFTLRPLLKRMPPAQAQRYRAMLAEP